MSLNIGEAQEGLYCIYLSGDQNFIVKMGGKLI